ncbi:hypothetical protein HPB52_023118 [Rhipicephalus sanguineus]|uniref:Uncharacterized protein n=1 Tax=Rhipicephalus sanguineus TaxID=34632 RepID=A0A9D4PK36_RHISA|nr:hypothetical protein HPB52_023118 [Rhipicephalus sanguineus]
MPKVKYTQMFRDEWLKDPMLCKWLVCKTKQDGTKVAECKYCRCELGTKYSDLGKHRLTEKHKAAATSTAATQSQITFPRAATSSSNVAEGRVALFVAEHCSIATADHLSGVIKKSFSDSHTARNYRMKRTKCPSLLKNVLYPHFKDDLSADIGRSKFSVIIDESTDQIRQRLPDNVDTLSKVAQLSVKKTLCAVKPSLIPLLESMGLDASEIQQIENQWKAITSVDVVED